MDDSFLDLMVEDVVDDASVAPEHSIIVVLIEI